MIPTPWTRPRVFHTWMALLAGDRVWVEPGTDSPSARHRVAAASMVTALMLTLVVHLVAMSARPPTQDDTRLRVAVAVATLAGAGLSIRPIRTMLGLAPEPAVFWWSVVWRTMSYLLLIAATAAVLPGLRFLGAVPIGLVGGIDVLLAMWTLGISIQPWAWLRRFATSTIHFGAIGALIGTAVFDTDGLSARSLLGAYAAMWAGITTAAGTLFVGDLAIRWTDRQRQDELDDLRVREREQRVHWLHDDVLSEVKLAALRIERTDDVEAARRELLELDHRLRLRQLEESMRNGQPQLSEIIQPHLRRAQTLGVSLDRVPSHDVSAIRLDEGAAQSTHRAISMLVSNAINAGATRLSLEVSVLDDDRTLEITLTDDAGGFTFDDLQPGRGLMLLLDELGPGSVRRGDAPGGSSVTVRVPTRSRPEGR